MKRRKQGQVSPKGVTRRVAPPPSHKTAPWNAPRPLGTRYCCGRAPELIGKATGFYCQVSRSRSWTAPASPLAYWRKRLVLFQQVIFSFYSRLSELQAAEPGRSGLACSALRNGRSSRMDPRTAGSDHLKRSAASRNALVISSQADSIPSRNRFHEAPLASCISQRRFHSP